jgi:hypothetical protein
MKRVQPARGWAMSAVLSWLAAVGSQLALPPPGRACTCVAPPPWMMTVMPGAASVAPRNTRIWVTFLAGETAEGPGVALFDPLGRPVPMRPSELSTTWRLCLLVLEPEDLLEPNALYAIEVRSAPGQLALRQQFHTSEVVDDERPAVPKAERVEYRPPDPHSTCGNSESLAVELAADVWIVRSMPGAEQGEANALDPAGPSGVVEDVILDRPASAELYSGPCVNSAAPYGEMRLGTFDLAGNFSGWSRTMRFEPGDGVAACSVRGALGRASPGLWPPFALAALLLLVRRRSRAVGRRG